QPRLGDEDRARPDESATEPRGKRKPAERPTRPAAPKRETSDGASERNAQERPPRARRPKGKPGCNPASEADDEPRRQLRVLMLEQAFDLLVKRGKPRLPIAPSTLWKRRFPYVRGARPLHCNMKRRGMRGLAQARKY